MRESFKIIMALSLIMILNVGSGKVINNVPVPGRYSGLTLGSNKTGIYIEAFYELLCDGTAAAFPIFEEFMNKPFLDKKVKDLVQVTYSFTMLPYHHGVWYISTLIPYI